MGFVLSILYFGIQYLTPAYLLGPFANLRIQLIIAALALLVSVPTLLKSFLLKNPQSLALIGLAVAVFLSIVIGRRWLGGGEIAFLDFIPNGMAYFLMCLHVTTTKRLKIVILMLLLVCLIVIGNGFFDLQRGVLPGNEVHNAEEGRNLAKNATTSPFLMKQETDAGEVTYRLQGLGEINDPNDFGQLVVCLMPLMFIFWREKKMIANIPFVIVPVCILLFGIYLTHSRGALVATTFMLIFAARRRIGTIPAAVLAGLMFTGALALQFTGGRAISATAGEDRTNLWGEGLQIVKSNPIFGVGYGDLWEHTQGNLTAHNSLIVCAAELGIFGLFFWCLYLFSTMRDTLVIASPTQVTEGSPFIPEESPFPARVRVPEEISKEEMNQMGRAMLLSLIGFLAAGWFLSRAFVLTLFLLGGMAEAIYQMALKRGMVPPRLKFRRVLPYSGLLACSLLIVMYIVIRVLNLSH
jgi:hypothetical protein